MDKIQYIVDISTNYISDGGIIIGFLLVLLESFVPILPLSVFVAFNVKAFGFLGGCAISWSATCLGSYICYIFFAFLEEKFTQKFLDRKLIKKVHKGLEKFKKIKFTELVLILTLPFTPSFLVNILSGLTKMKSQKFVSALLIGKSFSIIFWGYIGKSLLESLTDPTSIIYIAVTLLLAYIISKIVSKKMNIE